MPNDPLRERLDHTIDRLNQDIDRVEMWSAALRAWLEPVPGYESAHCEFLLPSATRP